MLSSLKRTVESLLGWSTPPSPSPSPRSDPPPQNRPRRDPPAAPVLSDALATPDASLAQQGVPRPGWVDEDGDEADGFFDDDGKQLAAARRKG